MLKGSEALALLLSGPCRVQVAPGSPLQRVERLLLRDESEAAARPARALSDIVALGLGLGGALLEQEPGVVLLGPGGLLAVLGPLQGLGAINDLRSGCVLLDAAEADPRGALCDVAPMPLLEAASPEELHHLTALALALSEAGGLPVAVRARPQALRDRAEVRAWKAEAPAVPSRTFSREEAPYLTGGLLQAYHRERRAALLARLGPLLAPLLARTAGVGKKGVILSGHLGRRAQARASGRGLFTLRLGAALPLPEAALLEFCKDREEVLVLEEGAPFLLTALQAMAHRAGLPARIRGPEALLARRPVSIDDAALEVELDRFGGPARGDGPAPVYDVRDLGRPGRALPPLRPQLDAHGELAEEPWPMHLARVRRDLPQFAPGEGRLRMLTLLHGLGRPALTVMAPGPAFAPGLGRALCDVQPPRGLVAAVAGALSLGEGMSGGTGGPPLCAALLGDSDEAVDEHLGVLDNARAERDVLHVLLQPKEDGAPGAAELLQQACNQATEVEVLRVDLTDEDLVRRALDYLSQRRGPRVLVCTDERLADSQVSA